jgi:hypothetical protein
MADEPTNLIPADEPVIDLQLTAAEMKVTWTALKAYHDDFGRDDSDLHGLVRGILARLPGEHDMRAIDLDAELEKLRALRGGE